MWSGKRVNDMEIHSEEEGRVRWGKRGRGGGEREGERAMSRIHVEILKGKK